MKAPFTFLPVSDAAKLGLVSGFGPRFGISQAAPTTVVSLYALLIQNILTDNFVNLNYWTVTDSGGKVTLSGGEVSINGNGSYAANGIALTAGLARAISWWEIKAYCSTVWFAATANSHNLLALPAAPQSSLWPVVFFNPMQLRVNGGAQLGAVGSLNTYYTFRFYVLPGVSSSWKEWMVTVEGGAEFPTETVLGHYYQNTNAWPTTIYPQIQNSTSSANVFKVKEFRAYSGYATDGPYLPLLADAGKLFAVSAVGTLVAGDLEDPEASVTGAVTFTGGATGRIRSYNATTGKANIHTISGTPQAGTVTCDVSGHTFTISDTGVQCLFRRFDLTRFKAVGSWATTNAKFRYTVDGGAPSSWLTLAQLNAVGNLGNPQRVALDVQANSDGATQQYVGEVNAHDCTEGIGDFPEVTSVIAPDTVQGVDGTGSAGAPAVLFALDADDNSIAAGGTIDFSAGEIEMSGDVTGAAVTAKIHNASTGAEIATVATATGVDFAAGVARTLADIFGAAPTWTDDQGVGDYELRVTVSDDEITTETSRYGFAVIQTTPDPPAWDGALTPGDGQVTLPVDVAAGVPVYAYYRKGEDDWSAESESFKVTGPGDITIDGLTNGDHYEFKVQAKVNGVYSAPAEPGPRFATPTAAAVTPTGPLSLPLDYLRKTLAQSSAFQAWASVAGPEAALDAIHPVCAEWAKAGAPVITAGGLASCAVADGGRGYRSAPAVTVRGPAGSAGATATATVSGGRVTGIVVGAAGTGYDDDTRLEIAEPDLPMAVVDWEQNFARRSEAGGSRNWFAGSGALALILRAPIDPDLSPADAAVDFMNKCGAVIEDLEELAGTAGYLDIGAIELRFGPQRPGDEEARSAGDFYQAGWAVSFQEI